jgi:hypothetical protein
MLLAGIERSMQMEWAAINGVSGRSLPLERMIAEVCLTGRISGSYVDSDISLIWLGPKV